MTPPTEKPVLDPIILTAGHRVRFTGYSAASFDHPQIEIGDEGTIVSAKGPEQVGFDFWVKMDRGGIFAFSQREVARAKGVEVLL